MSQPSDAEPASHYDRVTEIWRLLLGEELHYGVFEQGDEPLPTATAALTARMEAGAQLAEGLEVLDVGCGTGAPALHLATRHGVRVVGITTSQVGVDIASSKAAEAGLSDQVSFAVRDGTANGFPDGSFDRAWVLESSHLMPARDALVSECARVLRPGGRVVLCDIIRRREIPFQEVRARVDDFVTLRDSFGEARMDPLERYVELAEQAGLVVDTADDLTELTLPTFDRWRANLDLHRAEAEAALGSEGVDSFARSTEILEAFWKDGTFGYGLFAASKPTA